LPIFLRSLDIALNNININLKFSNNLRKNRRLSAIAMKFQLQQFSIRILFNQLFQYFIGIFIFRICILANKSFRNRLLWMLKYFYNFPFFDNTTIIHYRYSMTYFSNNIHLMCNHYDRQIESAINI